MYVTKVCKICGNEFYGKTNACYCSASCRREYETAYARKYRESHQEQIRTYNRNYWRKYYGKDAYVQQIQKQESDCR